MAEKSTFIKLDRNIVKWRWYKDINTFKVFESVRNNATCIFFWTQWLVKFIEIIHSFEIYLFKISENYETFVTKLHKFNIEKFFEQGVNNCIPKRKSK